MPDRFTQGALDLEQLKGRSAQAENQGGNNNGAPSQLHPFFTVTPENFENELVRRSVQVPVITLIGSARSPESEQLKNDLADLAAKGNLSFIVGYVDADTTPEIAQVFGVQALPTVLVLAAGRPVTNFEGGQPKEQLSQWVSAIVEQLGSKLEGLPEGTVAAGAAGAGTEEPEPQRDERLLAAEELVGADDLDSAISAYDEIIAAEKKTSPVRAEAVIARGNARLMKRLRDSEGTDVIAAATEPADIATALPAADAEFVAGGAEQAFDRLIEAMKLNAGKDKDAARERLLEFFELLGADDPRVIAGRTKMASALF